MNEAHSLTPRSQGTPRKLATLASLLLAAFASAATSQAPTPVVEGSSSEQPFTIDDASVWEFTITGEADASAVPKGDDRWSNFSVNVQLAGIADVEGSGPAEIRASLEGAHPDAGDKTQSIGVARGEERGLALWAGNLFDSCRRGVACRRDLTLRLEHLAGGPVQATVTADAAIFWQDGDDPPEDARLVVTITRTSP